MCCLPEVYYSSFFSPYGGYNACSSPPVVTYSGNIIPGQGLFRGGWFPSFYSTPAYSRSLFGNRYSTSHGYSRTVPSIRPGSCYPTGIVPPLCSNRVYRVGRF